MSETALSAIAEINPGARIPKEITGSDEVSFIPMSDVSESGDWITRQTRPLRSVTAGFTAFEEGDVLVAKITPCLENGKGGHAQGLRNGIGFGSTEFHVLRARQGVDPRFVFHITQSRRFRQAAERQMVGSAGQQRVQRQFFDEFLVRDFSQGEQRAIAQILETLDTAIRETEALIDKLKAVKQGLLHDLLTRGVDASGQLRPPQSEAPQLYKESPLGWIPREWEVEPIINLTSNSVIGPFGSDLVASDYRDSGVPVIFVRDVKPDQLVWKSSVFVSASKAQALAAHEVRVGDVVATKMGLPPCVAAVYPESMPSGIVTADIVRLRPCTDRICPDWMSIFINSSAVAKQVEQITAGVTRPKVTLRDVRDLLIGLPSIKEQERVLDRLTAMQSRIQLEEASHEKFTAEKAGLMDDLLTGRVRVTPLLESVQQSAAQTGA